MRKLLPYLVFISMAGASAFAETPDPTTAPPPGPPAADVPKECNNNPRLPGCPYWCRFHRKNVALCPGNFGQPGNAK